MTNKEYLKLNFELGDGIEDMIESISWVSTVLMEYIDLESRHMQFIQTSPSPFHNIVYKVDMPVSLWREQQHRLYSVEEEWTGILCSYDRLTILMSKLKAHKKMTDARQKARKSRAKKYKPQDSDGKK